MNYTIGEYAETIVGMMHEFCDAHGLPMPHLLSESGRALTAHHAVLITNVTDVEQPIDAVPSVDTLEEQPTAAQAVRAGADRRYRTGGETYYRAGRYVATVTELYTDGKLSLAEKAFAEQCYAALCRRLHAR